MRKILWSAFSLMILAGMAIPAHATVFTWNLGDLGDLDHQYSYHWGLGVGNTQGTALYNQLHSGNYGIVSATLKFNDIYDWTHEQDRLFVHLLDNPSAGTGSFVDNPTDNVNDGDDFLGQGTYLGYWNDPNGDWRHAVDLVYNLGATTHSPFTNAPSSDLLAALNNYILNNNSNSYFGFGFDPDCHYYNTGITLCIETGQGSNEPQEPSVPEPATLALAGIGLSSLAMLRRKQMIR